MTERKKYELRKKIEEARAHLLIKAPLFSRLLMYMNYIATNTVKTVSVNGRSIIFHPAFLLKLNTDELGFVLCHLLLHTIYGDIDRDYSLRGDSYHHACDIVVNSELTRYGFTCDRYPHLGRIFNKLLNMDKGDERISPDEVYKMLPYKLSSLAPYQRAGFLFDTDRYWDFEDRHISDGVVILESEAFDPINVIKEEWESRELSEKAKSGKQGNGSEEPADGQSNGTGDDTNGEKDGEELKSGNDGKDKDTEEDCPEKHGKFDGRRSREGLLKRFAAISAQLGAENGVGAGNIPQYLQRKLASLKESEVDWRKLLINFVSEQVSDYSFSPPDRRYSDCDFFLPDFNDTDCELKNIWFVVDTSGSMDEEALSDAYSEIYGALEQFGGKLQGKIGFFDTEMKSLHDFCSARELKRILPEGGGGTDFNAPFDYIKESGITELPAAMVIFTDGFADYPNEEDTFGIPVMWLLTSCFSEPPFGKVIVMKGR